MTEPTPSPPTSGSQPDAGAAPGAGSSGRTHGGQGLGHGAGQGGGASGGGQPWLAFSILLVAAAGIYYFMSRDATSPLDQQANYDTRAHREAPAALIHYREVRALPTGLDRPTCIAMAPSGTLYVGGGGSEGAAKGLIHELRPDGTRVRALSLPEAPTCLAPLPEGGLVVGHRHAIRYLDREGATRHLLKLEPSSIVTGLAASATRVYIADAGTKQITMADLEGRRVGGFAKNKPTTDAPVGAAGATYPEDVVTLYQPHLAVVLGQDGLLRVTDPGRHRLMLFDPEGVYITGTSSRPGVTIEGYAGCCNPVHLALLPEGDIVTSEKAIRRVKVVSSINGGDGALRCVVAPPRVFAAGKGALPIATDAAGMVYVLDASRGAVRVFARKKEGTHGSP